MAHAAEDAALVDELTALVNGVYTVAEDGLWVDGMRRTTPQRTAALIAAQQLAVASLDARIVGVIHVHRLDTGDGEFGMLAADPAYRGRGVGRELIRFAEQRMREQGSTAMQLELLVPKRWSHPSKELLKAWYTRLGYRLAGCTQLDENYPELAPLLATPCDLQIYRKSLLESS
jgi:ribosomal protein S18 acetylase RimI-like enzyme